jgi:hypothetical protein
MTWGITGEITFQIALHQISVSFASVALLLLIYSVHTMFNYVEGEG